MKHLYKKSYEIQKEPKIFGNREISRHNPIVANSIEEAHKGVKAILEDLDKLLKFEQEGKIRVECGCDSPSFMFVYVLDKSILPEIRKIKIVYASR
jgi:hypothetical protein